MNQPLVSPLASTRPGRQPSQHLARVKRSYAPAPAAATAAASNDASYLPPPSPLVDREALDAWARRAQAASGFGEAVMAEPDATALRTSFEAALEARAARSAALIELIFAMGAAAAAAWRRLAADWRQARVARETERALRGLDRRTLRDIGIDSGESLSVAAELGGYAERTRVHALMTLRHLSI